MHAIFVFYFVITYIVEDPPTVQTTIARKQDIIAGILEQSMEAIGSSLGTRFIAP
jgi:hypothetical protein